MDGLVEFTVEDGAPGPVLFEADPADDESGARLVSRSRETGAVRATTTFETALDSVRSAAQSALRVLRDGPLSPDGVEIEFGVKLSAEAGAVITKGSAEGHLVVRLSWAPQGRADAQAGDPGAELDQPRPAGAQGPDTDPAAAAPRP
ncbi:CU044_2847 family protein [Streptomyces sp. NPDC050400]|uniref:CU044_2847 family protein n=1 Tax=Streptomyces sp. NPDC050400 TaxID=3365610 RepID=UPI00379B5E11